MKRIRSLAVVLSVAAALAPTSIAAQAQELGYAGGLTAGIPPLNAEFQSQATIQEGGLHFAHVATSEPEINVEDGVAGDLEALPLLFRYKILLEAAGWTEVVVGGGGNPFGSPGGAQLTALHPDGRYLRLNAGHPGVQHLDHAPSVATFVDACVWPQVPQDDGCHPLRWIDTDVEVPADAPEIGSTGVLTSGIPAPAVAEYRGDDVMPEGGRRFRYVSAATHFGAFTAYLRALDEAGWTISDAMTHGDQSRGGGAANATDGTRFLRFSAGGDGLLTFFDACVWPHEPSELHCPRSGHD
ncbi:MAG: hypothetical protein AB1Z66_00395 [Candidatus Limnocylindrales bacterium]